MNEYSVVIRSEMRGVLPSVVKLAWWEDDYSVVHGGEDDYSVGAAALIPLVYGGVRPAAGRLCVLALCSAYTRRGGLAHGLNGPAGGP